MKNKPKIIVHTHSKRLNRIFRILGILGFDCQQCNYELENIKTSGAAHLLWGMAYGLDVYRELAELENVFFMENGWFTQSTGCYIDDLGTNGMSSIRGCLGEGELSETIADETFSFLTDLHQQVRLQPVQSDEPYIFLPLQVETDSQLLFWSGCEADYPNRQVWFVDQVCKAFPETKIIIRSHPLDNDVIERLNMQCEGFKQHHKVEIRNDRSSYDWIASAQGVIGINSTVLIEALSLHKPVCAMGYGIFTDNGVVFECKGNHEKLKEFTGYKPDQARITSFLHLLIQRQIPYKLKVSQVDKYPILNQVMQCARALV